MAVVTVMAFDHRRRSLERGFTFVELLIASTMVAIMFVGLATHLRGGVVVWERATQGAAALQRQRVALDRMARDLANAFNYETETEALQPSFESGGAAWMTAQRDGRTGLWVVRRVRYACESMTGDEEEAKDERARKEEPEKSYRWLTRTVQTIGQAQTDSAPTPERLLKGCEALSFRYAYRSTAPSLDDQGALEWDEAWKSDEHELPRLIEVTVELTSGKQLQRVMAVPAGVLKDQPV